MAAYVSSTIFVGFPWRPEDADTFQDMLSNSTMNVGTPGALIEKRVMLSGVFFGLPLEGCGEQMSFTMVF